MRSLVPASERAAATKTAGMYSDLRSFLNALDARGELLRVRERVSPVLEIAARADRESKSPVPNADAASVSSRRNDPRFCDMGGRALLFENVAGAEMPVLINAWGSYRRTEMALGCEGHARHLGEGGARIDGFEAIAARIAALVKPEPPSSLRDALAKAKQFLPLLRVPPKRKRRRGLCQEVEFVGERVDCTRLPIMKCWPLDGDLAGLGYPADVNDHLEGLGRGEAWDREFRGRYITLAGVHTIHADDRDNPKPPSHNIGMYRVQLLGPRRLAMHWHMHHDGARHWRSWKKLGRPMPVAIVLGGESVMPYAATCPLPPGISELLMAGFLNQGGIPLVRARTVPLWVPANAEIVIEGWVSCEAGMIGWEPSVVSEAPRQRGSDAGVGSESRRTRDQEDVGSESRRTGDRYGLGPGAVFEGPFGDHTGFYSMPDRYPIVEVATITHRRDPIYPTTVVGLPPQEDYFLGKATERIMLPLLKTIVHDVEDYDLPIFGAFHNCAAIKIKKAYPLQGRRMMHSVWGAGQMAWTKTVIVVDDDVDVHDTFAVLRAVGERCHPTRDVECVRGPVDILDHATPFLGAGTKMGLDATRKQEAAELHIHHEPGSEREELCRSGEIPAVVGEAAREAEARIKQIAGVLEVRVPDANGELGGWWIFVKIQKRDAGEGAHFIKAMGGLADEIALPRWTVVVGPDADLANLDDALFHWLANVGFERDMHVSVCGRRVAFDSTPKMTGDERCGWPVRKWPPLLRGV
jgi:4-hydroxy-3-polyprenylbenzoate decarboxylase